ncbi:VanW family protein [Catellatospora sp. KI3]|uniref:VanW family protein n=1 Tax=Catellatospora sp. KI3 TaxID=3041620 RepID=UPI00248236A2|nr:VanW family protein [Catellatospora sp. KI3]MDI1459873.1 VanW family protein [Catellatospora sp. KI3]
MFSTPGKSWRRWLIAGTTTAVALALVAAFAGYALGSEVPRNVRVLGVAIGDRDRAEAADALRDGLAARADQLAAPLTVHVGDQTATVQPQDVGLGVDVDATVAAAADAAHNPWDALTSTFGTTDVAPVVTVDAARLAAALQPVAAKASGAAMTLPGVVFDGRTPKAVYPKPGRALDAARAADAVRDGWLKGEVTVPLVDKTPASSAADVDAMIAEVAEPAVAAPVTVDTPQGRLSLSTRVIASSLVIGSDADGKLTVKVDEKKLRSGWKSTLDRVETQPKNAAIDGKNGKAQVIASTGGTLVDTAKLAADLVPVLKQAGARTVTAQINEVAAATTAKDLAKLGIREQVSSFTTYFTGGLESPRSKNIIQIAKEVDGAIVKPGETFSLNGHTGPRGYAEGYHDAPIIMDGKLIPGVGGGASQFTTTIFNASYYAGLKDVEHKPHSFYFTRYPAVIESTIMYPSLDLRFTNDTPYGVLIDTSYTADSITVSMWSTKVYDSITTKYDPKRDITEPKKMSLPAGPTCIATQGSQGFTQDAWRIFRKDGKELKREKFTWRYDAEPQYVCDAKPQ